MPMHFKCFYPLACKLALCICLLCFNQAAFAAEPACDETLFSNQTFTRNSVAVFEQCKALAIQKNPIAQANLGYLYRRGWGVVRDIESARKWYLRAKDISLAQKGLHHLALTEFTLPTGAADIRCRKSKVCRNAQTLLPMQVLPRPFSHIYASNNTLDIVEENIRAFYPLYVFAREELNHSDPTDPEGWYQVGFNTREPSGWMQARDVMEWRQALVVSYAPLQGDEERRRKPVLMFSDPAAIEELVQADEKDRFSKVQEYYKQIDKNAPPGSIISIEPKIPTDIEREFYILPVLNFATLDIFDDPTLLLQLAAAVPDQRSTLQDQTTVDDSGYQKQAHQEPAIDWEQLQLDIVFVMDLTSSMQPFIVKMREMILSIAQKMGNNETINSRLRFGLVGYRDNHQQMPELGFSVKNFTPELSDSQHFGAILTTQIQSTAIPSGDYAEEVYAGVENAILNSQWRKDSARFLILIGDASAHEPDHPQSTSRLSAANLSDLAGQHKVTIFTLHLRDEYGLSDHPIAEQQFRLLARNHPADEPSYFNIATEDKRSYDQALDVITGSLFRLLQQTSQGDTRSIQDTVNKAIPSRGLFPAQNKALADQAARTISTALINYLGGDSVRDITFWVLDRDLSDTRKQALQARVLMTRKQLNDLIIALNALTQAMQQSRTEKASFFDTLRALMAQTMQGAQVNIKQAQRLRKSNLFPKWIDSLPYKSTIMDMSAQAFESAGPALQLQRQRDLDQKLAYYREIFNDSSLWQTLYRDEDENLSKVFALPIDQLP